ncbi:MAG: hypothetical protein Q7R86_00770 [bacterium]|nr:hypothetical protein [bacterium]
MVNVTIPKKLAQKGDLVVIPRREYESLVRLRKMKKFSPTVTQKRALIRAEANLKKGKTLSFDELSRKLGLTS